MEPTSEDVDSTVGGMVLAMLGLILAAFTAWNLWTDGTSGIVGLLIGIVPGVLLALLLTLVGGWLIRSGPGGTYARRLVAWALLSGLFGAISAALFVVYETSRGATIYDAPLAVANTTAGFLVVGLVVGRYDVQAKRREAELSRYKELVNNIPVGIFRTTPGPDGNFVEVNPAMAAMFEADDERELLERTVSDLYADPEGRQNFSDELREEGLVTERETRYRRLDGETFWASVTAIRFEVDGQVFFDGILEDITERKRYEQALKRHNKQLSVLNDVLRHDVRNDMAVIRSHGEQLHEAIADSDLATDHTESVETLLARVEHVVDLTRTARDLAEAVSAEQQQDNQAVALADTLRDEIDAARQTASDVTLTVEGDLPDVAVRADDMLASVFRNLFNNAIKHNDSKAPHVWVSVETTDDVARVRIADDGPGIPDDQKEQIFEHGQKGEDSGGTGLGLYLVSVLVEQYGGHVDIHDNDPEGAVFTVQLPLAKEVPTTSWFD